jgi:hypothetical protein
MLGFVDDCPLRRALASGKIKIPEEKYLPGSTMKTHFVFLGDEAFPLTEYLMRPFPRTQLQEGEENDEFNYRLSRTRMVVECSFGSVVTKFRLLGKAIETKVENSVHIGKAITLLHNVIRDLEGLTEIDVHKITAIRTDPRAYMPPSKKTMHRPKELCLYGTIFEGFLSFVAWCVHNSASAVHSAYLNFLTFLMYSVCTNKYE